MISDNLKYGAINAPHRSLYHALGLTDEELTRPMIGIVSSYNEIVPGHTNIDKIVDEAIKWDGIAHFISRYDGKEIDLGNGLYAYRQN